MHDATLPSDIQLLRLVSVIRGLAHLALAGSAWVAAATGGPVGMASTPVGGLALGATWVILGAHGALQIIRAFDDPASEAPTHRFRHLFVGVAYLLLSTTALGLLTGAPPELVPPRAVGLLLLYVGCRDALRTVDLGVPGAPRAAIDRDHRELLARFAHVGASVRGVTLTWVGATLTAGGRLEGPETWLLLGAGLLPTAAWCLLRGAYRQVPGTRDEVSPRATA